MQRIILLSILLLFGIHISGTEPKYELRGVWLTTNHRLDWPSLPANNAKSRELQKNELCAILDSLQKANFNTVFFQVRTRGDLFYPSAIEPWSIYLTGQYGKDPGYDPLAFVIDECHKRGMECHAWFVTFPVGNDLQVKQMGKQSPVKRKPKLCKRYNGEWYLDPGEPGTTDYLRSLVKEIVQKYDIDGIHFDYIRYPENAKGFPDNGNYRKYGKKVSLAEWRRQNITRIENALYDEVKRLKPHVLVSTSPLGKYQRLPQYPNIGWTGVESVYQDAGKWLREEKCDFVVPMMYYLHEHFFPFVDNWVAQCGNGFIAPGLGIYRLNEPGWCLNDITDQIDYGRFHNTKGNVFFRCKNLLSDTELYKTLKEEYYRYPALIPHARTSDDILPPQNITVQKTDSALTFGWEDPSGLTEPIYLLYRVQHENGIEKARLIAQSIGITTLTVPAEKNDSAAYFLTVYNRRRNESRPSATIRP